MKKNTRSCVVSLIGRPNTGKSSIFNRLMGQSFKAMTHNQPGVTRDRHYGIITLDEGTDDNKEDIIMVDTGGFYPEKVEEVKKLGKQQTAEPFFNIMAEHARLAIDESDLILFVVDVREGLIPFDKSIAKYIRTTKKPMWLLVNKFDDDTQWGNEAEFYELGIHEDSFFIISAAHGRGVQTLKERLYNFSTDFQRRESVEADEFEIQKGVKPAHDVVSNISIIGAPNAGKSTLLNQLIGAPRALVSDIAGTTVDPIEGYINLFFGKEVSDLKAHDNQFRRNDAELYREYIEYEDEFEEETLFAYNSLSDELKGSAGDIDDNEEVEIDDEALDASSANDMFSLDDLETSVDLAASEEDISSDERAVEAADVATEETMSPHRSVKVVDTAGIRKRGNVQGFIEEQSVYRSLKAISESDVVIYMVDATRGIGHQDRRLIDIALDKGKSLIVTLNKVDLIKDIMSDPKKKREWLENLRIDIPWLSFCELLTISAKNGSHIGTLRKSLQKTILIRNRKIGTSKLNKVVGGLISKHPIALQRGAKGASFKIKYASMLKASPPTFLLFANRSQGIPANYKQYLKKGIRTEFNLINTPIHLIFRTTMDIEKRLQKAHTKEESREESRE